MKKGYTLVEVLAVVVLLTLLTFLAMPPIVDYIRNSSGKENEVTKSLIMNSAKMYVNDNFGEYEFNNNFAFCIPVSTLVEQGYLEAPVKYGNINDISNVKSVRVTYNNYYTYNIVDTNNCSTINYLAVQDQSDSDKTYFFNTKLKKDSIEAINILNTISIPDDALGTYDVSELNNKSIMLWYLDIDSNNLYEVYIGSTGNVRANVNSSKLFANLTNLHDMDLSYFDTTDMVNASNMFANCVNLDELDLDSFATDNLVNTSYMFINTPILESISMSNAEFASVDTYTAMFAFAKSDVAITVNSAAQSFITARITDAGLSSATITVAN